MISPPPLPIPIAKPKPTEGLHVEAGDVDSMVNTETKNDASSKVVVNLVVPNNPGTNPNLNHNHANYRPNSWGTGTPFYNNMPTSFPNYHAPVPNPYNNIHTPFLNYYPNSYNNIRTHHPSHGPNTFNNRLKTPYGNNGMQAQSRPMKVSHHRE